MQLYKYIGIILIFSFLGLQSLSAQTQNKTTSDKKQINTVKSVPTASKNKTALKTATKQVNAARKQQIKKAVRKSNMSKRPIRRR